VPSGIVSDALLQDLMACGQADIVVGIATFNDATTVGWVLDAVLEAFATTLLRERTVVVAADAGSRDGTLDLVRGTAPSDAARPFRHPLRTVHRIGGTYAGAPSGTSALRMLLSATELLGARSLVVVDPADIALSATEVTELAQATFRGGYDLVTPLLPRAPGDGPLVTQLVRPLVRALWARRLMEPLALPFACSGRLAVDVMRRSAWAHLPEGIASALWVVARGLSGGWNTGQLPLGERDLRSARRAGLVEIFTEIVITLLECAAHLPASLVARDGSQEVALLAPTPGSPSHDVRIDADAEAAAFRSARALLEPLWAQILSPDTLSAVLAQSAGALRLEDELWVRTVYEFLGARQRAVMPQGQLARALLPLYQGRVASFLASIRDLDANAACQRLEALALEFERQKPAWRWALGATAR
jgi:hypothetical protein